MIRQTARSLPCNFLVILEEINEGSGNFKVQEIKETNLNQIVELVQEFSKTRYPDRVKKESLLCKEKDKKEVKIDLATKESTLGDNPPQLRQIVELHRQFRRKRRGQVPTSTNKKGLKHKCK